MKIRVIKAEACPFCKIYLEDLKRANFPFEIYDGDAEANQDQLDQWNVKKFPVVQVLDDSGKILHRFPDRMRLSVEALKVAMDKLSKGKKL